MDVLTLAQLRQNPSAALRAVESAGVEFVITNHRRPVAKLVPYAIPGTSSPDQNRAFNHAVAGDPGWAAEVDAQRDADLVDDRRDA